jgi:hypothetical protein
MRGSSTNGRRLARWTPAPSILGVNAAAMVAKLKGLAPYALMELVLPGGSVVALLFWLYRRQKKAPVFATHEILSFL